ncbi:TPA: RNA methyltransferase [Patescibacteria group bacterium]|nr:MAG: tRNA/rRNA methyltransferase (SpoU) [Parcubacteria group bacterium GW2011_GWD2_42_14]HCC05699.1 RNA methyltransferase [Patescibacteria group bacterium]
MQTVYLILHNIRSTHNVGSILRTADAAGVRKVYLCGYTPAPIDRFGRKRADIAKVALGAEESVVWKHEEDVREVIQTLKEKDVFVVAVEQDASSVSYTESYPDKKDIALIVGEETKGIEQELLDMCHRIVEIPMAGEKESLNVAVAAGIVLFRLIE